MKKLIYNFKSKDKIKIPKNILGGKGANLAEMGRLGFPVPSGFTISTKACDLFYKNKKKLNLNILKQIKNEILQKLDDSLSNRYIHELEKYQKTKPMTKKTMEFGMKLISSTPSWASDRILTLYLNKIRRGR